MRKILGLLFAIGFATSVAADSIYPPPPTVQQTIGTWIPADGSGATLVFTGVSAAYTKVGNIVFAYFQLNYPSTVSASNAAISGFPIANANSSYAASGCFIAYTSIATLARVYMAANTTTILLYGTNGVALANSVLSLGQVNITCIYPAT